MPDDRVGKVFFVGAGPGDPELLTLKGKRLLSEADLILYSGSLVPPHLLGSAKPGTEIRDTARMPLNQQIEVMANAVKEGKVVVRLHTGDPSIFGALDEQIRGLEEQGISYEVVPGVSSVFAAAAALGIEFTLPELTQTLILSRLSGRTPVPELESLRSLAAHQCSLALFLSTNMIESVSTELQAAGYPSETPIAVVYRASWPDQVIIRGTLANIQKQLEKQELTHQGLIIISPALKPERKALSHLYGNYQSPARIRSGIQILALTRPAAELGRKLLPHMQNACLVLPKQCIHRDDGPAVRSMQFGFREAIQSAFRNSEALVCIMATGIVVREIASLLTSKHQDPAVLVLDPLGQNVISLLSGHEGGANRLAEEIARITGGKAVITTASDHKGIPALDLLAQKYGWSIANQTDLAAIMGGLVNEEPLYLYHDEALYLPAELKELPWAEIHPIPDARPPHSGSKTVFFTYRSQLPDWASQTKACLRLHPKVLLLGIGCNRGCRLEEIESAISEVFAREGLALESIAGIGSVVEKRNEAGLLKLAEKWNLPIRFFTHEEIESLSAYFSSSPAAKKALGVSGVAEPCAMLMAGTKELITCKQKFPNLTIAIAQKGSQE
jgi:precorrin-4 C11-methyltransferase